MATKIKEKGRTQEFQDVFHGLCKTHGSRSVWDDFLLIVACGLSNTIDSENVAHRTELYEQTIKRYSTEEVGQLAQLQANMVLALKENPDQDFLGEIFQGLELNNRRAGQFFTPYNVSKMMAMMSCGNPAAEIKEKGYITVSDCCCGAGGLLIAYANAAREQGVDVRRDVLFVAQDIDLTSVLMTYVQIAILGCAGYVIRGDTLRGDTPEQQDVWYTPMYPQWYARHGTKQNEEES
ncbi:MAG: N-6 DNA methylase [Firmicutes bacterium]|nr:N-6 DNA methylase [Bacillota bacterium]